MLTACSPSLSSLAVQAMAATALNRDFNPVGLKVMVLDEPGEAAIVESQLQGLQYTVTVATSVKEALAALEASSSFDVALVAAPMLSAGRAEPRALLRKLKSLPFVLTGEGARPAEVRSSYSHPTHGASRSILVCVAHSRSTQNGDVLCCSLPCCQVMLGIKLGAAEFLEKPLCPLKLKNIWQHTVRRILSSKGNSSRGLRTRAGRASLDSACDAIAATKSDLADIIDLDRACTATPPALFTSQPSQTLLGSGEGSLLAAPTIPSATPSTCGPCTPAPLDFSTACSATTGLLEVSDELKQQPGSPVSQPADTGAPTPAVPAAPEAPAKAAQPKGSRRKGKDSSSAIATPTSGSGAPAAVVNNMMFSSTGGLLGDCTDVAGSVAPVLPPPVCAPGMPWAVPPLVLPPGMAWGMPMNPSAVAPGITPPIFPEPSPANLPMAMPAWILPPTMCNSMGGMPCSNPMAGMSAAMACNMMGMASTTSPDACLNGMSPCMGPLPMSMLMDACGGMCDGSGMLAGVTGAASCGKGGGLLGSTPGSAANNLNLSGGSPTPAPAVLGSSMPDLLALDLDDVGGLLDLEPAAGITAPAATATAAAAAGVPR
jgi:CheY-like chemotaxis protein